MIKTSTKVFLKTLSACQRNALGTGRGGRRRGAIAEMEEKAKVVKLSALCSRLSEFCPQLRDRQRIAKAGQSWMMQGVKHP